MPVEIQTSEIITALKARSRDGAVRFVQIDGFVDAEDPNLIRLYRSLDLRSYIEIKREDITDAEVLKPAENERAGSKYSPSRLYVDGAASVKVVATTTVEKTEKDVTTVTTTSTTTTTTAGKLAAPVAPAATVAPVVHSIARRVG